MNHPDVASAVRTPPPPLSWPPPGLERLQGRLWRAIAVTWIGALLLVVPLLFEVATQRPFWSLGAFEGTWEVGVLIAAVGLVVLLVGFGMLFAVLRGATAAAEDGYGTLTIMEVASDVARDTGFLIQGRRFFGGMDPAYRARIVEGRIRGAVWMVRAPLLLLLGFGLSILLAARGLLTPTGVLLASTLPAGVALVIGVAHLFVQSNRVREAKYSWAGQAGRDSIRAEAEAWTTRLEGAGDAIALGAGPKGEAHRFRVGALGLVVLFLVAVIPAVTVAMAGAIGPILAEIAVPQFLSVQEMAGAAEVLRRYRLEPDGTVPPQEAGAALQNVAFVGEGPEPGAWEKAPTATYGTGWFPDPGFFPDPFSETVARDLMLHPMDDFSDEERAALTQAADHPAHGAIALLARSRLVDVVAGRWALPFPDTLRFQSLPWPRFAAVRTAGLAQVAKAAVEVDRGDPARAETTLRELVSTGFLLVDQGPTLIDNLMGVVLANMGGDALEGLYGRTGRTAEAEALRWAREASRVAASKARAGLVSEDIHSLLQGIPDLVVDDAPLRGLRWEYFATFNMLAPCINAHKMVFGPDDSYEDWRFDARDALVRVSGERELFGLAEGPAQADVGRVDGFLPRFLRLTLGGRGSPGSCAALIESLRSTGTF